jgi:hypothetical protein
MHTGIGLPLLVIASVEFDLRIQGSLAGGVALAHQYLRHRGVDLIE